MNIGQTISDFFYTIINGIISFIDKIFPMPFMLDGHIDEFQLAIYETLIMFLVTGFLSLVFGLILGVITTVTKRDGILENKVISFLAEILINFFRSVPFVILIPLLLNVSRGIMGTSIGLEGTYVPLIFGTVPFFARQVEASLSEVDHGLIEASKAMGDSPLQIIFRVYLKESIPSITRGTSITFISLLGLTAMAGHVGGGGLGAFAIRFGYQSQKPDATWASVVAILLIVSCVQLIGNMIVKRTTH
ncbi:MAG: methionine ABC transporter permease [Breznakia sp.]